MPLIVALSASEPTAELIRECKECQFDELLASPLNVEEFEGKVIRKALVRCQLQTPSPDDLMGSSDEK